jgi:hypothetical protein
MAMTGMTKLRRHFISGQKENTADAFENGFIDEIQ